MRNISLILFIILLSSCYNYKKQLCKYNPDDLSFLREVDTTIMSAGDISFSRELFAYHPDSTKPSQGLYLLYLYTKQYKTSFIEDTLHHERKEKFAKNFMFWVKGKCDRIE